MNPARCPMTWSADETTAKASYRPRLLRFLIAGAFLLPFVPAGPGSIVQAQQPAADVRGRVTDVHGAPVPGARISILSPDRDARVSITGRDGRYRITYTAGALVTLVASAEGYRTARLGDVVVRDASTLDVVLEPAPYRLGALSVTGRTRAEIAAIPGAVTVVGPAVLRDRAPVSVMDALRTVPGVHAADEDPFGLNLNVGVRGLPPRRSSRTLLLEDGMPILLGPYGDPTMHYAPPVEAVDRIEVIKGSSQVMNGPQTVGGVINFVTRQPPAAGAQGSVTIGAGSPGYRNAHLSAGSAVGSVGVAIDYTFREGNGVRREQRHRFHNALLSTLIPVADGQSLLLKGSIWNEASQVSETGLTQVEFDTDPFSLPFSAAGRFDVRRYAGQVMHEVRLERVRLRASAYASTTDRASWRQSGESEERLGDDDYAADFNCAPDAASYDQCGNQGRPREYDVAGLEPRLTIDIGRPGGSTIDIGARLYREDVSRRQFTGDAPSAREDDAVLTHDNHIATRAGAGFGQVRLRLGSVRLSPAIRIERLSQTVRNRFPGSEASIDVKYTQLLPGVGATFTLPHGAVLFSGVHRGFAPPRPADVYRPEPGQPLVLVDPETSWTWELGGRLEHGAGVSAEATLFRMDFGNQIIEAPADAGQRFTNGGRTVHQGVEIGGSVTAGSLLGMRDDLTIAATLTYLPVARFRTGDQRGLDIAGNRLPYAPRALASGSATFAHRTGITVGTSFEYTGEQFADAENTIEASADGQRGMLPAYGVLNAFLSYAVPASRLQVRTSARNVLDAVYITQRNEHIQTGTRRIVRVEIQWSFQE